MSEAEKRRHGVLSSIRAALGVTGQEAHRNAAVRQRISEAKRNLVPERAQRPKPELLALFRELMEGQSATVVEVASLEAAPSAIADYLRGNNLPLSVRSGSDPLWEALPWSREPALERHIGPATGADVVGLSHAAGAAAESGTLVLTSGPDNPTSLNFLPENHIVVVHADDIAGSYEEVWSVVRKRFGAGVMPRTVNFVSGPSRTADIAQKLVMGAHGPRKLMVLIVKPA